MPTLTPPSAEYLAALRTAAERYGIEREYWDIWGKHHTATPETLAAVLASLGVDTGSIRSLDEAGVARGEQPLLPPTLVSSVAEATLPLRLPAAFDGHADIEVTWEDGSTSTERIAPVRTGQPVRLPFALQLGYHDLAVTVAGQRCRTRWIVCPERAYFPDDTTRADSGGLSISLYGVRSERNWGCGDFTDLAGLAEWAARELRVAYIGLNPLHAIANRSPYNTSPYLPLCALYKNLIYLDPEAIGEFASSKWAPKIVSGEKVQGEIRRLREGEFVDYEAVYRLKLRVLRLLYREFLHREFRHGTARAAEFARYVEQEGRPLHTFAVFCALDAVMHRADRNVWLWTEWPEQYHDPDSQAVQEFAQKHWRTVLFFKYVQWQIDVALEAAQQRALQAGMAIGLYHDLALATDRYGADFWGHRRFYIDGCRVGSPPDDFSPSGQDWSFPPPNAQAHFDDGYRLFADSIRKNLRHGGALRIDHVMRFFRLFWIPDGVLPKDGTYVCDRHADLIRILALESVRNRVIVVGEDLGTVTDAMRETLSRFGILSYRLFFFERHGDGTFKRPTEYEPRALVSSSTHDLPTLAGFWLHRDIDARRDAGFFHDSADYWNRVQERMGEKQKMLDLIAEQGALPGWHARNAHEVPELTGELHYAIVRFLAATPAALFLLSEEDLMKQPDQQNLPGTTAQYPNWRHKTRFTLEEMRASKQARDFSRMYRDCLIKSNRAAKKPA